jgi:hypothetical protein
VADLTLEPYAAVLAWRFPEPVDWHELMTGCLESLAARCEAAGPCVIGHLKALALFPGEGMIQVSVVGAHLPATVQGQAPVACADVQMTVNALVYGLSRDQLARFTSEAALQLAERWKGDVVMVAGGVEGASVAGHTPHDHPTR